MYLRINEITVVRRISESDNLTKQIVKLSNPAKPVTTVKLLIQMQLTMKSSKTEGSIRDEALSDDEVSPLDETALYLSGSRSETALVTSVSILGSGRLEHSHPRPANTGSAKSEERCGSLKGIGRSCPNPILFTGEKGVLRERSDRSPNTLS